MLAKCWNNLVFSLKFVWSAHYWDGDSIKASFLQAVWNSFTSYVGFEQNGVNARILYTGRKEEKSPGKKKNRTKFCWQEEAGKVEENVLGQKPLRDDISITCNWCSVVVCLFVFLLSLVFFCTVLFCFYETESPVILNPSPAITMAKTVADCCPVLLKRVTSMEKRQKCHIITTVYK